MRSSHVTPGVRRDCVATKKLSLRLLQYAWYSVWHKHKRTIRHKHGMHKRRNAMLCSDPPDARKKQAANDTTQARGFFFSEVAHFCPSTPSHLRSPGRGCRGLALQCRPLGHQQAVLALAEPTERPSCQCFQAARPGTGVMGPCPALPCLSPSRHQQRGSPRSTRQARTGLRQLGKPGGLLFNSQRGSPVLRSRNFQTDGSPGVYSTAVASQQTREPPWDFLGKLVGTKSERPDGG